MIPVIATAVTWLRAFKGPCLILSGVALCVGVGCGGAVAWKIQAGKVAREELKTAGVRIEFTEYREAVEKARGDTLAENASLAEAARVEALGAVQRGIDRLSGQIAQSNTRAAIESLRLSIERLSDDPQYDCRKLPLPDPYLDGLRIPRPEAGPADPAPDSH